MKIKPVMAWMHVRDGELLTGVRGVVYWSAAAAYREKCQDSVVRVEIRVVPNKRKRSKGVKHG